MQVSINQIKKIKILLYILLIIPSLYWFLKLYLGKMGVNPIEAIMRQLGEFSLILIVLTLSISPLSKIKIFKNFFLLRRQVGLFAFYYICLHLISYVVLDHFFNWEFILKDIYKRPFITLGFLSFVLILPLAITSNNNVIKKLTYNTWKKIHRLIYFIAPLATLHFYLITKSDKTEPIIYLVIINLLLAFRIFHYFTKNLK